MKHPRTETEIRNWLVDRLCNQMHIPRQNIDLDQPIERLGIDSLQFVVLVGELEEWLGTRFTENPLARYSSINAVSRYLAHPVPSPAAPGEA
jgi:polyketide synthase 13